jgi:hypothetical protein
MAKKKAKGSEIKELEASLGPVNARTEALNYWRDVMKDKDNTTKRRDMAAKELTRIAMSLSRLKHLKTQRKMRAGRIKQYKELLESNRASKKARLNMDVSARGKKAVKKEVAVEIASGNTGSDWADLIPKAQVLPFKKAM